MCILQAARSPGSSHIAFPTEARRGTMPCCLPNLTGHIWPFGAHRGLAEPFHTFTAPLGEEVEPLPANFPVAFLGGRRRVGPPELWDKKSQQLWNLQKVGWYCMHAAIQTRCLHAFLPTLPYPHWSVPRPTGSFSFLYLEPFSTKARTGEGCTCAVMTYKRLWSAKHKLAPSSRSCHVAFLFPWSGSIYSRQLGSVKATWFDR